MYKSAYMVQIMRSKRSIKDGSKAKKMYISQISKNAADAGEMWYYLYYTAIKNPKLLRNFH